MTGEPATMRLPRELGNGLLLRRSTTADTDRLAEFDAALFSEPPVVGPDETVAAWVRDLLNGRHPTFREDDFLMVEDTATGRIVSSSCWISQKWTYAGIPFNVGRPEVVGTDPAYRNRGLVRAQFDAFHAISAARGELVQAITGIPFYYRQFGYEMAVDLGGGRVCHPTSIPKLKEGADGAPAESEPFRLRPAVDADAHVFLAADAQMAKRSLIMCARDEADWRYEISGKSERNGTRIACYVLETAEGATAGALAVSVEMEGNRGYVPYLELLPGFSYLAAAPSLLRAAWAETVSVASAVRGRSVETLQYGLGADHPFYRANVGRLAFSRRPYAWYIRVPDLKAFLRLITPTLENRLAASAAANYTGDLLLSFYRSGLRLTFDAGALREIADWPPNERDSHAALPGLTFTQLLMGHRTVDELREAFTDFTLSDEIGRPLLEALFPRQSSRIWAVT